LSISQAVILAGGFGKRLGPITANVPKPLVKVAGQPFLFHLIKQLKRENFTEIIILAGYKSNLFVDMIKNYEETSIKIKVIEQPTNFGTGARIVHIMSQLNENFLLLYGDNYCGISIKKLIEAFKKRSNIIQLLAYEDLINFSKPNLDIDNNSVVTIYDTERKNKNLKYVDVGYMCVNKNVLKNISFFENLSLSKDVLSNLVKSKKICAYKTYNQYCTVGNMQRLQHARSMLDDRKFIFLDRDGVLNKKANKGQYITKIEDIEWREGSLEALSILKKNSFETIVVTNQAGIGRGIVSENTVQDIHSAMCEQARHAGGSLDYIYMCPHHWEEKCFCRKPKPGMFLKAQKDLCLDFSKLIFVGDQIVDREAAETLQIKYLNLEPDEKLNKKIIQVIQQMEK